MQALKANNLMKRDVDYIVKDGERTYINKLVPITEIKKFRVKYKRE